jgi:hypothetical protein
MDVTVKRDVERERVAVPTFVWFTSTAGIKRCGRE